MRLYVCRNSTADRRRGLAVAIGHRPWIIVGDAISGPLDRNRLLMSSPPSSIGSLRSSSAKVRALRLDRSRIEGLASGFLQRQAKANSAGTAIPTLPLGACRSAAPARTSLPLSHRGHRSTATTQPFHSDRLPEERSRLQALKRTNRLSTIAIARSRRIAVDLAYRVLPAELLMSGPSKFVWILASPCAVRPSRPLAACRNDGLRQSVTPHFARGYLCRNVVSITWRLSSQPAD